MKRKILFGLFVVCLTILCACGAQKAPEISTAEPQKSIAASETVIPGTGYASGEVQRPYIYVQDCLYVYADEVVHGDAVPADLEKLGTVKKVDNDCLPQKEFSAARMNKGEEVWGAAGELGALYVPTESDYLTPAYMLFIPAE